MCRMCQSPLSLAKSFIVSTHNDEAKTTSTMYEKTVVEYIMVTRVYFVV